MRILQVIHDFLPRARAGTEIHTYQLSRELMKRGHEIALFFCEPVFTLRQKEKFVLGNHEGMRTFKIRKWPLGELSSHDPFMDTCFERTLRDIRPDLVHFQHLYGMSLRLPSLAKERGMPTLFTLHDHWLLCPMVRLYNYRHEICTPYGRNCTRCSFLYESIAQGLQVLTDYRRWRGLARLLFPPLLIRELDRTLWRERKGAMKRVVESVDLFLAMSEMQRNLFAGGLIEEGRIRVLGHGLHSGEFRGIRRVPGTGKVRVMYLGQVARHKGVDLLIKAFNRIDPTEAELRIYGRVTDPSLRLLAKNRAVRFMGPVAGEAKREAFARSDLLVVPSRCYETGPMVILEALASKVPVIVSNTAALSETVEARGYGLIFQAGKVEDLATKVEDLISEPEKINEMASRMDPSLLPTAGDYADRMESVYAALLAEPGKALHLLNNAPEDPGRL